MNRNNNLRTNIHIINDEPIGPQDVHEDMSRDNLNIAAGNSLISSGL